MDKIITKIIETAVAPIIALLTDINNKLGLVTGVAVQVPAVTPVVSRIDEPALTPSVPPAAVNVTPAVASKVTREAIGQSLLALARSSEAGMATAQALLVKYVPADQETKTLAFVPEDKYIALFVDLAAATTPTTTPAKAAESLI